MSQFDNILAESFRQSAEIIAAHIQSGHIGTSTHIAFVWNRARREWVASATTATVDDEASVTLLFMKEKT